MRAASWLQVRTNAWFSNLKNDIGYDASNSRIVNRYDNERLGWETELLFDAHPAAGLQLDGWASYSFVHLLGQTVTDPGLATSDHLTGAPAHLLKAGARLRAKRWTLALQGMWQGEVERRENEMATPLYRDQRPDTVAPWIVLDASIHYRPLDWLRLGLNGKNLFDSRGRVAAPIDAPFDYHVDGRRVMMELELSL